jgi:hypothetical protein
VDDVKPVPAAPKKALKWNKAAGVAFGVPARDLTADEVHAWVSKPQYDEMIESGAYSVVEETPATPEDKKK